MKTKVKSKFKDKYTESQAVLAKLCARYQEDPVFFAEHCLGLMTWSGMREILESVRNYPRTAVRASHSVSKTFTAAIAAIWFFNAYQDSKVVSTAPTDRQVKNLLWAEIGRFYRTSRFKLSGICQEKSIRTDKSEHYSIGFSTDQGASSEGFHAPELMFVFDEAKGIPQWAWDAADGALTGGFWRWLVISTTDGVNPGEHYHKIFTQKEYKKQWNQIHISAERSPFVTGEKFRRIEIPDMSRPDIFHVRYIDPKDVPQIQLAVPKWIKDRGDVWGKDSVLYLTKVEGQLVDSSSNVIIALAQVYRMFENYSNPEFNSTGAIEIGVDVARGGTDDTVMYKRKGMKVIDMPKEIRTVDLPAKAKSVKIADEVKAYADHNRDIRIKIDDTGVGGGVVDILQHDGYSVIPIIFGADASNKDKYPNTISEMWYEVGKMVDQIACPEIERLKSELSNRKAPSKGQLDKKGRRLVESKDDYKKRGFRSPDHADAFLLCFYNPGLTSEEDVQDALDDIEKDSQDSLAAKADW